MPAPLPHPSFRLRPVAPPDESLIFRLYAETRSEEMARTPWSHAQQEVFLRGQFTLRRADYANRFPGAEHSIIVVEGREIGVVLVYRGLREIRIVDLALLAACRGRGVGGHLLTALQAEARAAGLPLVLRVAETNRAQSLYLRLGFLRKGAERGYFAMIWHPRV